MTISLIIPCYNEEANLQKGVLDKIENFVLKDKRFLEVLIVDDGSQDQSKQIIRHEYLKKFPKFKLIENKHQGKAQAVITGIKLAKGDYVIFSDIDLATPIEEAEKLIKEASQRYPLVIGSRQGNREGAPFLRKVMALGGIFVRNVVIGLPNIHDTQCGFKLFEKKAALHIIDHLLLFKKSHALQGSSVSAGFDMEFLYVATRLGYGIKEVPVAWRHVETKNVHFLRDSFEALKDILEIKYFSISGRYNS